MNQDPIGLMGGTNFYQFAMNALGEIDPLGLSKKGVKAIIKTISGSIAEGFSTKVKGKRGKIHPVVQEAYNLADGTLKAPCSSCAWVLKFLRMKGKK